MQGMRARLIALLVAGILLAGARCVTAEEISDTPRTLNNFVTELLQVRDLKKAGTSSRRIETQREGWLFFRTDSWVERGGSLRLSMRAGDHGAEVVLIQAVEGRQTNEVMRYLPKGSYDLSAELKDAELSYMTVRVIPAVIYASHPYPPLLTAFGQYDWAYLKQIGMLDSVNVIVTGDENSHFIKGWLAQGKQVLQMAGVPGVNRDVPITENDTYAFWMSYAGLSSPNMSGIIADEFYQSLEKNYPAYIPAIKRVRKERPDKVFYPYVAGSAEKLKSFVQPLLDTDCRFAYERYLPEQRTLEEAQRTIERELKEQMLGFNGYAPGFAGRCIYVMGFLCGPNETVNKNPAADFKVFTDMQFHLMATDPALKEMYGVQEYLSGYCDNEYLRWCAKLFRHYCIEGSTERLTNDPYILTHIANPDFERQLEGWTVSPAANGSIRADSMAGYGYLEGRWPRSAQGDTFAVMTRSVEKPNEISQEIRNLQPGRYYSVKAYTGGLDDLTQWQMHELSIRVLEAEPVPEESIQGAFHNCYDHLIEKFGNRKTFFNFHRIVFRATGPTAKLVISDWANPKKPAAPIGQQTAINFIEVEPYLMPD